MHFIKDHHCLGEIYFGGKSATLILAELVTVNPELW
jgi:hypothetical protein